VVAHLDIGADWQRVSHKYVVVLIVGNILWGVVGVIVSLLVWWRLDLWWWWILLIAVVGLTITMLIIAPRRARSIGYQLRDDDLLFCRGIMFQRYVAVPYGRMQLIDINRGPVGRLLHLADLKFVTAAATTGVGIPGLNDDTAAGLRDRLVALAETRRAGL
jgi:membrane protein YdbS with pleckstrin-like domain